MYMYQSLIIFVGIAISGAVAAEPASCNQPAKAIPLTGKSCGTLTSPQLSCYVPKDVQGGLSQANNNTIQRASDIFSWQQFIALNWPAAQGKRGEPAADKSINAAGPRVWETWKEAYEVYKPDGGKPADWNTPQAFPAACGNMTKLLIRTGKVSDVVDQQLQALPATAAFPASLKDQQGRLVRYEIRLNKAGFDYVVQNNLYNGQQQTQASAVDFPAGSQLAKAAWREVDGDAANDFLTTDACVCEDAGVDTPSNCQTKRMGLAGFHLMTKTASAPQWIWSTYEQVDNITSIHPSVQSLNKNPCPGDVMWCRPNMQTPDGVPTQLTRVIPIPSQNPVCSQPQQAVDNIAQMNGDVQKALAQAGSVLANYHLVNTQWPVRSATKTPKTVFTVRPALLGNTTMESFSQDTSSCMGCHVMSRTLKPDTYVSGDFSFTLNNAQPRPKGARCVNVEASESCNDDILTPPAKLPPTSNVYSPVLHGYAVATKTYETVGKPYVGNKLHCQSCHLDAGGNPAAAWWVDMAKYYKNAAGLQTRINSCFKHSMNGKPLCTPGKDCDSNKHMVGLIAYMKWQTAQYYQKHPKTVPVRGYPNENNPAFNAKGNPSQGQAIYTQKCAFCHNKDGQGRYQDGYFRPALWGNSYNASAGMGPYQGTSSTLAAFLHGNMPYTSGGLLTIKESVDLAAFINSQCRPGKKTGPNGKPCPTQ